MRTAAQGIRSPQLQTIAIRLRAYSLASTLADIALFSFAMFESLDVLRTRFVIRERLYAVQTMKVLADTKATKIVAIVTARAAWPTAMAPTSIPMKKPTTDPRTSGTKETATPMR